MLKEKIPNTHRETREKPSLSEQVDLALTVLSLFLALILRQHQTIRVHGAQKTSSSVVASHKEDHLFFVKTAKRYQEFSTNFSTKDSRIISEKSHSITPFYLLKHFIRIESETKVTWHCGKVYLFFFFLFKCLYVRL